MKSDEKIYTNETLKKLIFKRDILNIQIEHEIKKEKAKYKFAWKRFLLLIAFIVFILFAFEINVRLFAKTSIFSWEYYLHKNDK